MDAAGTTLLMPRFARPLFGANALLAWTAVVLQLVMSVSGYYVDAVNPAKPTILGNTAAGIDTPLERFFDWISYFTIWSNIVVAVVLTALTVRPALFARTDATGAIWRALRLDSVVMIVVTGVVYNLLLAQGGKSGLDAVSNTLLHVAVPIVTLIVWIIAGPRDLIRGSTLGLFLIVPLVWAAFALIRGQAVGAYPYPFLDVATNGWASVLAFLVVIIVVALVLAVILWAIDAGLAWTMRPRASAAPVHVSPEPALNEE